MAILRISIELVRVNYGFAKFMKRADLGHRQEVRKPSYSKGNNMNTEHSNLKTIVRILALSLVTTFISGNEIAHAVTPAFSTSSNISNGSIDPNILLSSTNFSSDVNKFAFIVDMGTTGLTFDSASFINPTKVRLNLRGTARAGELSVQANKSAFSSGADDSSKTLTITVPDPLIAQTITFDALKPMSLGDNDQILSANSTSSLDVTFSSKTPNTCRIVSQKINPIAAGKCSIKASQSGDATYQAAPDIIQSLTISSVVSGVVDKPATNSPRVTTFATLEYSPDAPSTVYKDLTISSTGTGQYGATNLKLSVPSQATQNPAVFLVTSFSTDSENDQGFFVARIGLVDKGGNVIDRMDKAMKINIPKGYFYSEIFWSSDGLMWQRILETKNESLPTDTSAAFFREVDGSVSIITREMGLFGYRFPQADLKVLSPAQSLALNGQIQLSSSGGSGTGAVTFGTSTASVCTVTADGVVSAKQAGKCFVFVRKYAAQHFIDTVSTKVVLSVQSSTPVASNTQSSAPVAVNKGAAKVGQTTCTSLSYSLNVLSNQAQAKFCPKDAGNVAILYIRSASSTRKWVDKEVARSVIDANGIAVFDAAQELLTSDYLHVFVNGQPRLKRI